MVATSSEELQQHDYRNALERRCLVRALVGETFVFAGGTRSEVKVDATRLGGYPQDLRLVMGGIQALIDEHMPKERLVVVGVPNGGRELARVGLSRWTPKARLAKANDQLDLPMRPCSLEDERLVRGAKAIALFEDIVSTGGSAAATADVIHDINPDVEIDVFAIGRHAEMLEAHKQPFASVHFLIKGLLFPELIKIDI